MIVCPISGGLGCSSLLPNAQFHALPTQLSLIHSLMPLNMSLAFSHRFVTQFHTFLNTSTTGSNNLLKNADIGFQYLIISAAPTAMPVMIKPIGLLTIAAPIDLMIGISPPKPSFSNENAVLILVNTLTTDKIPPLMNVNPYPSANVASLNDIMPVTASPMYLISVGCFSAKSARLDAALPKIPTMLFIAGSIVEPMFVANTDIWFFNSCKLFAVVADRISNSCCILFVYAASSETISMLVRNKSKLSISAFIF